MTDISTPWPFHFTITFSEDELRIYRKEMAGRRRRQNAGTVFGLALAAILALGLTVFAAFKLGMVEPSAVRPMLITGYCAFATGLASFNLLMRYHFRKFYRADGRGGTWHFLFDDAGISYKSETIESRLMWRAVDCVEDLGPIVLFHFGAQAIGVPPRIFRNNAERAAFVAAAAARIKPSAEKT